MYLLVKYTFFYTLWTHNTLIKRIPNQVDTNLDSFSRQFVSLLWPLRLTLMHITSFRPDTHIPTHTFIPWQSLKFILDTLTHIMNLKQFPQLQLIFSLHFVNHYPTSHTYMNTQHYLYLCIKSCSHTIINKIHTFIKIPCTTCMHTYILLRVQNRLHTFLLVYYTPRHTPIPCTYQITPFILVKHVCLLFIRLGSLPGSYSY